MRYWITEDAQANRGIDIMRDLAPTLEIGECVTVCGFFVLHQLLVAVIPSQVEESRGMHVCCGRGTPSTLLPLHPG